MNITPLSSDILFPAAGPQHWNSAQWDDTYNPTYPAGNSTPKNFYYRFNWQDIESNTVQGSYSWTVFDTWVNQALAVGAMFSFGVMIYCNGCGSLGQIPQYVVNLMASEGKPGWSDGGFIVPNYQSTNLKTRYTALLQAIAAHITANGWDKAFLGYDIRHYGNFGEGWGEGVNPPTGADITDAYMNGMIDVTIATFPNVQLTIPMNYVAPNGNYGAIAQPSTFAAWYALTKSNNYGRIGWRRDNIGDDGYNSYFNTTATYNGVALQPLLYNAWQVAPIGGEPANDLNGISRCGSPECDLQNEINLFHYSYIGNGNLPIVLNTPLKANLLSGFHNMGYRLSIISGSTSNVSGTLNTSLLWNNSGPAPVYEKWNVQFQIRSGPTVLWTGISSFNPRLFLPGQMQISDSFTSVPFGDLYIIVTDPLGYKKPMPLAITGQQLDGSYLLQQNMNTLIVIWGESNAAGNAPNSSATSGELAIQNQVKILDHPSGKFVPLQIGVNNEQDTYIDSTHHGFELAIADLVNAGKLQNPIYIVKIGVSGSYICQWLPGTGINCRPTGGLWEGWIPFVDQAVAQMPSGGFNIVVWGSLGLNDAYSQGTLPAKFMSDFATFRSDFRARYGANIPFYCTDFNNPPAQTYAWDTYFQQMAIADPLFFSISCIGATYVDAGVHFDYAGFKLVANNIVSAMGAVVIPPSGGTQPSGSTAPTVSIFTNQVPVATTGNDNNGGGNTLGGMEVGMRFKSSIAGFVTGVRFYKTSGNAGTHIGELYSNAGVRLAQATFTGETTTGWQSVVFATPIPISGNTTYVVAYFSSLGNYVEDNGYFSKALINANLTAIADGGTSTTGNGPFDYASAPQFPTTLYKSANYWVDVIFSTGNTIPPPPKPPVASISGTPSLTVPPVSETLDGSASIATALTYSWTFVSGPSGSTIATPATSKTVVSGLYPGIYVYSLKVTDSNSLSSTINYTITVHF